MGNSNGKPVILTDEVNLNHFRLLRVVGKGAFGKVRIVERKDTGLTFALKYIRKDEVVRSESVRNIIRERRMLEHLNHPFLCNLSYIVVDLMTGGDLRFHISRKTFTEEAVRFWIAELGCALRYIHQQGIVHRDVKPDNILLDVDGHVHLADFNVASELTPGRQLTSKSGTMAYLAPEVYQGKGYQSEVDWWSLGVTFYECIYNRRPFEAHHHEQLAQSIVRAMPPFHTTSPPVSNPCLHAISSLLEKDKTQRIGAAGFETFTDNPFFRAIDFAALERKEIDPVFCPSSDKTNFDATYDLEELLLEEAPLEARARKQKPRAELRDDATQQEIRAHELHKMIETMFEPFNYTQLPPERAPTAAAVGAADAASGATTAITATGGAVSSSSTASSRSKKSLHSRTSPPGVDSGFSELSGSQRARPKESHHKHHKHQSQSLQQQQQQQQQQQPSSRSQTPHNLSHTRSSNHSADGSPPLLPSGLPQQDYFSPGNPSTGAGGAASAPSTPKPAGLPPQNLRARMLRQEEDTTPVANNVPSSPVTSALSITSAPDSSSSPTGGGNNSSAVAVGGAPTSSPKSPPQNRLHKDQNHKHRSSPRSSSFGGSGRTSGMGIFQQQHIQQHVQVQQHVQQVQQQRGPPLPAGGESEVVVIAGGPAATQGQGQGQGGRTSGGDGSGGSGGGAGGGGEKGGGDKPTGMLGFLSRKKGRDRSPKGKEKERGVLGKEGARVIVH